MEGTSFGLRKEKGNSAVRFYFYYGSEDFKGEKISPAGRVAIHPEAPGPEVR